MLAGMEEDRDVVGTKALAPQLLAEACRVSRDRLLQAGAVFDPAAEGEGHRAELAKLSYSAKRQSKRKIPIIVLTK